MSTLLTVENFDPSIFRKYDLVKKPRGNPYKKDRTNYLDCICAFDIESTNLPDIKQAIMYIWQFQVDMDYTIIGRSWQSFLEMLEKIKQELGETKLPIFVHNLSYEWEFLSGIYRFASDEVFCMDDRKILRCSMFGNFEFRCSYLLTNMSLAMFTKRMGVEDSKLSGYDYKKLRFPDTELSDFELQYCINDVLGLVEALKRKMENDGDTIYTMPLTSTGYVRKEAKKEMDKFNHQQLRDMLPNDETYRLLREAFRGGNTHCSRWFSGIIVDDAKSVDRSSSYPDVMVNCKYPVTPFFHEGDVSITRLKKLMFRLNKALLFRIALWNVKLKDRYWGCPYIPVAKCRNVVQALEDNGRILSADYLEITVTDIDFKIILQEYEFSDSNPYDVYSARYGKLPQFYIDLVIKYYKLKTELKGDESQDYFYHKTKELLNSLYGMMVQDPCKPTILYTDEDERTFVPEQKTLHELLEIYRRKAFIPYQWGVWVSAWGRYRLEECIRIANYQFIYADTDSVKYVGNIDISEYNRQRVKESTESGAYAVDSKGKTHYMGVFEPEGEYSQFVSMGAKKYCYIEDGELHLTLAGVNKKKGADELKRKGGIEAFEEGFIFSESGGTNSYYNDLKDEPIIYRHNGKEYVITSNVYIEDDIYTLGLTQDYKALLLGTWKITYAEKDIPEFYKKID